MVDIVDPSFQRLLSPLGLDGIEAVLLYEADGEGSIGQRSCRRSHRRIARRPQDTAGEREVLASYLGVDGRASIWAAKFKARLTFTCVILDNDPQSASLVNTSSCGTPVGRRIDALADLPGAPSRSCGTPGWPCGGCGSPCGERCGRGSRP